MAPPKATLGGVPLVGQVTWNQTSGAAAPFQAFTVHESEWSNMKALLGKPVSLVIESDTAPRLEWKNLYPLRESVTSKPFLRSVIVSDVRYKWMREVVIRAYNIPRKTGNVHLVAGSLVELLIPYDEYGYAYASLKDLGGSREKWLARDVIEDVLGEIAEKCGHEFEIRGLPIKDTPALTVENVDLFENADHALSRVLRLIPQAMVTVDKEGTAIVFDGTDRASSDAEVEAAGPPTVAGQIDRLVDLSALRPKQIHVYFERDVELRFDSDEEGEYDPSATVPADSKDDDAPLMDNVLQLTDPYTTIDGERYAQGVWVPIKKVVPAWNEELSKLGKDNVPSLTMANIRKHWFRLEQLYAPFGKLTPDADEAFWVSRIGSIRTHFRQTYQIRPAWMQRIRDLRPERIGATDPQTGTRAHAQAWSQYCIEPTSKAYAQASLANDDDLQFAWLNIDDYPGYDTDVWDKSPSPAKVSVVDRGLGVLSINYASDPFGLRAQIHPSMMKVEGSGKGAVPSFNMRDQLRDVMTINGKCGAAAKTWLDEDHRVAVIVTARPFAPNSESRCYVHTVDPSDIKGYVGSHFQVEGGTGPDWHIVVPPSLCTAWYALRDVTDGREGAQDVFGFGGDELGPNIGAAGGNDVEGYEVMNVATDPGPPLVPAMANAVSAAQWAAFVSQREGTRAVHLAPGVEMTGAIEGIQHTLAPDGRLITSISMPASRRPLDPMALIPNLQRPLILGTIVDFHP